MAVSSMKTSPAFWVTGPGQGRIEPAPLNAVPEADSDAPWVEVETLYSGISRGTESLVFQGRVPESEHQRMRSPFQQGEFPFPVSYGYINVGRVVAGEPSLLGKTVFSLFRHQRRFRVPAGAVTPLPDGLPPERGVLAANMETAINGLWDGQPAVGDRIAVVGCGVVGCLVAWLASRIPGTRVTAIDTNPRRRAVLETLGVTFAEHCDDDDHDLVFHTSGHGAGLSTALALAGQEGRIVEMSWYGATPVTAPLGEAFHARRLQLVSSQVGHLPAGRTPRWDYRKRMALALELLQDDSLDQLITGESAFETLPEVMATLATATDIICHRIVYQ
ncbi:zinc-binding alcohol dehydrogenase [uncultured Marinobacter sp.]|uniref:zinc-dependent alcohol dehydrogenase n=1 Tax=uncultured Marinobacter sp. TaxID=187379 RepID=UPI0030DBE0AC